MLNLEPFLPINMVTRPEYAAAKFLPFGRNRYGAGSLVVLCLFIGFSFGSQNRVESAAVAKSADGALSAELKTVNELTDARSFYKARKILEPLLAEHPKSSQV
ncbi:MAG TPA: hypothetical protein PKW73_15095, partial [Candidatus Obscuribacter sp.]|nr:hypothetical protein [Candidatus Obscuribacter sp.]